MDITERVGAWLTSNGCFFRVWAPHADTVRVLIQDPPYWADGQDLASQDLTADGGYWSATVPGPLAGKLYRFEIANGADPFATLDPAAGDVFSSQLTRADPTSRNASVIAETNLVTWAPFTTPRFENFIIYELHVGSFAGCNDGLDTRWATFRDVESKLEYIREMGFNAIALMPVHEHALERSWGYNPASFFAPESSYGSPSTLAHLIDAAHRTAVDPISWTPFERWIRWDAWDQAGGGPARPAAVL